MTEDEQERRRAKPKWLWFSFAAVVALLSVIIVPPLVSVSRYKGQIATLIGRSLGRPARISSVHVRLLPRPGFVLYDLVVDDNPAFGAEPVIHASTVTAPIRFLPLWRGRLEISEISVDEASLNLVRTPDGKWNLDSLLEKTATNAGKIGADTHKAAFPRLVATNSRINFKRGVEKLPYSLIDTDLSLWQSKPGEWRLRLRGQPARTDVSINPADTGIVELQATAQQQTGDLRDMPIHLDLDWRDAQLGQLSRLMTGSDAGWRGDLRGEVHMDGTSENAQIKTRLRATGVHRAEFAPAEPMDFDANCNLVYHYTKLTIEDAVCDSPIGGGRIRVAGEMNSSGHLPKYSVEMDRVPLAAGLEALRTVRNGVDPNLTAAGAISGKVTYDETPSPASAPKIVESGSRAKARSAKAGVVAAGPLSGSFTVEGFQLNGGGLSKPLNAGKVVVAPTAPVPGHTQSLASMFAIPAGAPVPLTLDLHLAFRSYQLTTRGQVSAQRAKEIAHAAGLPGAAALDQLTGEALVVDLNAQGPWLPVRDVFFTPSQPTIAAAGIVRGIVSTTGAADALEPAADSLTGTVTLHNASWKADYLANRVEISDATLHLVSGELHWDPINFIYGPLNGTATLTVPRPCDSPEPCSTLTLPNFSVRFSSLDAATMQTAVLGAKEQGTLVSDLLERLRPSVPPVWPELRGTVVADALILGPVTLQSAKAQLHVAPTGIEISALDGKMLGGALHASGMLVTGDKPDYTISADLLNLNPTAVGQLLGQNWLGGTLNANGKVELVGYTGSDLSQSAKGTLHFEWRRGAAAGAGSPAELARFDRWTGDADIADGKVTLAQNELAQGGRKRTVAASAELADPVKLTFPAADTPKPDKPELAKKR
jgi:hypothetical protein